MFDLFEFSQCLLLAHLAAAIAGIATWSKWKDSFLKWFILYLNLIVLLVAAGNLLIYFDNVEAFTALNQKVVIVEILFIHWFFYKILSIKKRKIIFPGVLIYSAITMIETYYKDESIYFFQSLSYTLANLFILVYVVLYFMELTQSNKLLLFYRIASFWIVCGILLFYLGTFPFYGLYNELAKNLSLFYPLAWMATGLNYTMYIFFTIGLVWGKAD
jgi:hypothetical protein